MASPSALLATKSARRNLVYDYWMGSLVAIEDCLPGLERLLCLSRVWNLVVTSFRCSYSGTVCVLSKQTNAQSLG